MPRTTNLCRNCHDCRLTESGVGSKQCSLKDHDLTQDLSRQVVVPRMGSDGPQQGGLDVMGRSVHY